VTFRTTGGARIGWVNANWPLAQLTVTSGTIEVSGKLLGTYTFTPEQVVEIEPYGVVPLIGRGIKILHGRPDYPASVIFWCFGSAERLVARIRGAGFIPSCPVAAVPIRKGVPFRWSTVLLAIALWNALFLVERVVPWYPPPSPGPFALAALALAFAFVSGVLRSARLQSVVLKPGRSLGEIRAFLLLLQLVTGLLLVALSIEFVFKRAAG
jgi:hypothetical protein